MEPYNGRLEVLNGHHSVSDQHYLKTSLIAVNRKETKNFKIFFMNTSIFNRLLSQETMEFRQALGNNINEFYQDAATCSEVSTYHRTHKTIGETILSRFVSLNDIIVLSQLMNESFLTGSLSIDDERECDHCCLQTSQRLLNNKLTALCEKALGTRLLVRMHPWG